MVGRIEEIIINFTGYEAILLMDYEQLGKVYCSVMLDHEHEPEKIYDTIEAYLDDKPAMKLQVGSLFSSSLKVNYGNNIKVAESSQKGYIQNIEKSPHAIFTCKVLEVTEDDILKCDLGNILNKIEVEFEESTENVTKGDMINFSGEFALVIN